MSRATPNHLPPARAFAWHVAVLIPARNEEALLPRCLRSIAEACQSLPAGVTTDVVVAADNCFDGTAAIAREMLGSTGIVIEHNCRSAGTARAIAARVALARYDGPLDRCWLANTDADSFVPADWLTTQLHAAQQQVHALAGIIDVDSFAEHDPGVPQRFRDTYLIAKDGSHPHVHGANLGVRADRYVAAGGWSDLVSGEDHDLWNRLALSGARRASIAQLRVTTSGRRNGRAPAAFAGALAAHNAAKKMDAA